MDHIQVEHNYSKQAAYLQHVLQFLSMLHICFVCFLFLVFSTSVWIVFMLLMGHTRPSGVEITFLIIPWYNIFDHRTIDQTFPEGGGISHAFYNFHARHITYPLFCNLSNKMPLSAEVEIYGNYLCILVSIYVIMW